MAVEAAKDPMQFGNAQRCADARAGGIFDYAAGKMSLSQAGIEGEPVGGFELILGINGELAAGGIIDFRERTARRALALALRWVMADQAKSLVIFLRKTVQTRTQVIALLNPGKSGLAACIFRSAVFVEAGVVCEAAGVPPEAELIVGLIEIANGKSEFGYVVTFEAGARRYVKDPVSAITIVGGITAALHFERVNVLGVNLRAQVTGDVVIGNRHAVDEPAHLMPATNVELIVSQVRARNKVGNHGETVGA